MCTGFCERGEGGKGGGELGSDKKVEPTGWKVIFLAESHVGCREQGAPRFPPASLNACVVLVLITSKALVILGHTSLQEPTCAWWSRLTFAHIYILQTHAQSGGLHMSHTRGTSILGVRGFARSPSIVRTDEANGQLTFVTDSERRYNRRKW